MFQKARASLFALVILIPFVGTTAAGQPSFIRPGYALIINTWNDFPRQNASNVAAMPGQALQAYFSLKSLGFDDNHITLLLFHKQQDFVDFDGDGGNDLTNAAVDARNDDVNASRFHAELDRIGELVNNTDSRLIIYLVGHGTLSQANTSSLTFENGDSISGTTFSGWLHNLNCGEIVTLLDFCYSGKFASNLIDSENRVVVSSSDAYHEGWFYWNFNLPDSERAIFGSSGSSFFHPFWKMIQKNCSIEDSFNYAKVMCAHWGILILIAKAPLVYRIRRFFCQLLIGNRAYLRLSTLIQ